MKLRNSIQQIICLTNKPYSPQRSCRTPSMPSLTLGYNVIGKVSHGEAETKAFGEYEKFWQIQDKTIRSDFDKLIEGLE